LAWCGTKGSMDYNEEDGAALGLQLQAGTSPEVYKTTGLMNRKYVFEVEYLETGVAQCVRYAKGITDWPTADKINDLNKNLGTDRVCFLMQDASEDNDAFVDCVEDENDDSDIRDDYIKKISSDGLSGLEDDGVLLIPYDSIQIEGILENVQFLSYIAQNEEQTQYVFVTAIEKEKKKRMKIASVTKGDRQDLQNATTSSNNVTQFLTMLTIEPAENLHIEPGQYFGWWRKGSALIRAEVDANNANSSRPEILTKKMEEAPKVDPTDEKGLRMRSSALEDFKISFYYKLKVYRYNRDSWNSEWYDKAKTIWSRCNSADDSECK